MVAKMADQVKPCVCVSKSPYSSSIVSSHTTFLLSFIFPNRLKRELNLQYWTQLGEAEQQYRALPGFPASLLVNLFLRFLAWRVRDILGDPGAVSGGGKKSKRARKKFGRRKVLARFDFFPPPTNCPWVSEDA